MSVSSVLRSPGWLAASFALLAAGLAGPHPAHAQDYSQIAPKTPAPPPPAAAPEARPQEPPAPADPGKVVLARLDGLRFVPSIKDVVTAGARGKGLDVAGVPGLQDPRIRRRLAAYIGRPLTLGDLRAIQQTIIRYYRARRRPLVDVAIPEQDVSTGVVQIVVTRFVLGQVKVEGNRWFSSAIIRGGLTQASGDPLDIVRLKHDLDWLNHNPFRRVDVQLEKGEAVGATDVVLQSQDRFPLRVFAGLDNSGTSATGLTRWSLGFDYGNLFGLDQQIAYQVTASDDMVRHLDAGRARFLAHSVSYTAPLPWRDLIEVFGSYALQRPDIGPYFGQTGHSGQASIRYIHPMGGPSWLSQELRAGFDFKSTNNNLDFGGVSIFAATQEVDQFLLTYAATEVDPAGATTFQNDLVYSPGGLTGANTNAAFALSGTAYAKADYLYDTVSVTRATRLPLNASWVVRAKAQWSSGDLLPSEQLGAGGEDSVRGYDTRIANGSEGYLVSQELRSPPFSPTRLMFGDRGIGDAMQLLAFWDYANVFDPKTQPKSPDHVELSSVGAGVHYTLGRFIDIACDYGWQLNRLPGAPGRGSRAQLAITAAY